MSHAAVIPDVLTLDEAASYLRLPKDQILYQATHGVLPGRQIDDAWRFLKAALDDWLRVQDRRALLLQQAGMFADDPTLALLRDQIYHARQRPEIEEEPNTDASA